MSSKEAHRGPGAEDLALRVRPPRQAWRTRLSWLSPVAATAVALACALLLAGIVLILRDAGTFSRRRIEFAPLPQLESAISAAQAKLRENPQDIKALVELGTLHFEKGKDAYPDAINLLEEARELGALEARIFYCLGVMYQEVGLPQFALEEYRKFLRHYPDDKEIRMLAAKLLYKQGSYSEAVSEFERLKFHFPNDPIIDENLGHCLWGAKSVDRAVDAFTAVKAAGGDSGRRAEFYLGQIAFEKGEFEKALAHFESCAPGADREASFGVEPLQVLTALASTRQKLGKVPEALEAWERALKLAPNDAKAKAAVKDLTRKMTAAAKKPAKK